MVVQEVRFLIAWLAKLWPEWQIFKYSGMNDVNTVESLNMAMHCVFV